MTPTILIVEDDEQVRELVARYLERDEMQTITAATGKAGLDAVRTKKPDLVLLDVNLPDIDGWSILKRLRSEGNQPAVIMLTARSDEPDRLLGLDLGADDYIVKPFSPREVVARVKAVLRRINCNDDTYEKMEFPGMTINLAGRVVQRGENVITLTPKEFDLLVELARHPSRVIQRMALYDTVWGDDGQGDDHTLDVHINRLRRKLAGDDGFNYVVTVKGVGFKFEATNETAG